MNSIEETLWNYIDGNCNAADAKAVMYLIENNEAYSQKYKELLAFNKEIASMELDEPPMAFTYNVIESIRKENAGAPLKAAINKRIITGIAVFFGITILGLIVIMLYSISSAGGNAVPEATAFNLSTPTKMPQIKIFEAGPVVQGFLFFDVILGLFLFDKFLCRRYISKNV